VTVLTGIAAAEERYRAEHGAYLGCSESLTDGYPRALAGPSMVAWTPYQSSTDFERVEQPSSGEAAGSPCSGRWPIAT
jgi:hypothetical protein